MIVKPTKWFRLGRVLPTWGAGTAMVTPEDFQDKNNALFFALMDLKLDNIKHKIQHLQSFTLSTSALVHTEARKQVTSARGQGCGIHT